MCSPDIPDTSGAQIASIEAQKEIAAKQFSLQQEALSYFKDRQTKLDATSDEVTKRQLAMAEETQAQGRDWYNYQKDVFRPVEQSLVTEAMRESTPDYYEQYAQRAVAAAAAAGKNAQTQAEQDMASMGINPNSGAWAAQKRGLQLQTAAQLGAVANDSRDKAESLSWAKRADVAGIGKGLVGAGNASYGLASGANSSAVSAGNDTARTAGSNLGTPTQYGGLAVSGANNVTGAYNDIYKTQMSANNGSGLAGALGNMAGQWAGSASGSAYLTSLL